MAKKITKKEAISSLVIGGSVVAVTPLAMTVVPHIYQIPVIGISVGTALSAGVVAYVAAMLTAKYI